jgi:hypothetical protein
MEDPLAEEFVSWREKCKPTIRSTYQILSRGTPNLENETWVGIGQRHQRHRHAAARRREAAEGPRQLVQAGKVKKGPHRRARVNRGGGQAASGGALLIPSANFFPR